MDMKEVWFVISPHNPLKDKSSLLQDYHRLEMVNLAIDDDGRFRACDIEFRLPQPSYTIDTLTNLKVKYPGNEFVMVSGSDILPTFNQWKDYERLLESQEIYIYPRPGEDFHQYDQYQNLKRIQAPLLEISATSIREAIKLGKCTRYMLPPKVFKYIMEMHFYSK